MTSQTKKFIDLWDIVGVQLQCRKCNASLLVGGDTLRSIADAHNDALWKCPTCGNSWTIPQAYPGQMSLDTEVKKFLRMVESMQKIDEQLGFHLRFEIKDEGEKK